MVQLARLQRKSRRSTTAGPPIGLPIPPARFHRQMTSEGEGMDEDQGEEGEE